MSELRQKNVLFIEPAKRACDTPFNRGNLFLNRFAIDKDVNSDTLTLIVKSWKTHPAFFRNFNFGVVS